MNWQLIRRAETLTTRHAWGGRGQTTRVLSSGTPGVSDSQTHPPHLPPPLGLGPYNSPVWEAELSWTNLKVTFKPRSERPWPQARVAIGMRPSYLVTDIPRCMDSTLLSWVSQAQGRGTRTKNNSVRHSLSNTEGVRGKRMNRDSPPPWSRKNTSYDLQRIGVHQNRIPGRGNL